MTNLFTDKLFKSAFGKDADRLLVGFETQAAKIAEFQKELAKSIPTYPPYNIKKVSDNKYQIELAVAGFGRQDLDIELADNKLVIRGNTQSEDIEDNFIFKGIGMRAFTRTFMVDDQIEVKNAELINGMLKIVLEKFVPEHKKPKKIEVSD